MSDQPSEPTEKRAKSRWPKKTIILVLVIGGLVLATPHAISYGIKKALIAAGADNADVEQVHFNPWTGDLQVDRLAIEVPDLPTVVIEEAGVNIDWSELFHRRIVIERVNVRDTDILIQRNADGSLDVIGIEVLPPAAQTASSSPSDTSAQDAEADDGGTPVVQGAGVTLIQLDDISLEYRDEALNIALVIDSLEVHRVHTWEADRAAQLSFKGTLNGTPVTIDAQIKAFSDTRTIDARLSIDGLDLNAFEKVASPALEALAGSLGIDTEIKAILDQDSLHLRQNGTIGITDAGIAFSGGRVDDKAINWQGLTVVDLDLGDGAKGPAIELDGRLETTQVALALSEPAIDLTSESLAWQGKLTQGAAGIEALEVTAGIELGPTELALAGAAPVKAALDALKLTGLALKGSDNIAVGGIDISAITAEVSGEQAINGQVTRVEVADLSVQGGDQLGAGSIKLSDAAAKLGGAVPVDAQVAELSLQTLSVAGAERISAAGLSASEVSADVAGAAPLKATLGALDVAQLGVSGGDQITAGTIKLKDIQSSLPGERPMDAQVAELSVSDLNLQGADTISATRIEVNGSQVSDQASGIALGAIGGLNVDQLAMAGTDSIDIAALAAHDIRGLAAKDADDQVLAAKALTVSSIAVRKLNDIEFGSIELADSTTVIARLKNGSFHLLDELGGAAPASESAPAEVPKTQETATDESGLEADASTPTGAAPDVKPLPIRLRIGEFHASGENALRYTDAGVEPKADISVIIDTLSFKNVDTGAPEQRNEFKLAARVGKYGKINAEGDMRPVSRPPVADLTLKIDALDMKVISPFLVRALGYIVESGAMDLDTSFKVDPKGEMAGNNTIKITQLVLEKGDEKVIGEMAADMPMPLDQALDLLRDDNNIIELEIPISGNINDPNIDFSDAIGTVVGKAVGSAAKAGAMTYLQTALFPYGTLLTVAQMGAEHLGKVALDPILYADGSNEPTAGKTGSTAEYLGKVAEILKKDEKFNLRLCPFYTLSDARAIAAQDNSSGQAGKRSPLSTHKDQTVALSKGRADALKELLIKNHQVSAKRVLVCEPDFDDSGDAKARVDLLL